MFKLAVFVALVAVANAAPGFIGASYAAPYAAPYATYGAPLSPWGHGLVGAPLVGAPVVKAALPVATSYANSVRISSPLVAAHAPVVAAHAPLVAAPAYAHAW